MKTLILYFFLWIAVINIYGFLICGIDKHRATKNKWRISEKHLFIVCFIGGVFGIFIGMQTFRHKTKTAKFIIGVPIICILYLSLITFLVYQYLFVL